MAPSIDTAAPSTKARSLVGCAFVLGCASVLQAEQSLLPLASWYAGGVHRACVVLLIWTALTANTPSRRLAWTIFDTGMLLLPWLISKALPLPFGISFWLSVLPWLGNAWCGAMVGTALAQVVYALDLPRLLLDRIRRRNRGSRQVELKLD